MMNYRRLGRTNLRVSAIGFGTCQLRLVPEKQAIETLRRGFELGVNLVHTAPDYEGADKLVARAIRESSHEVIVCSQGYGSLALFEHLFESACREFDKERLSLFGIACIDDREILGENVWGRGGMIDFLLRKKEEGRIRGVFCTTHGAPHYIRTLIERDVFDALMIPYNPLGFHLLSGHLPGREPENLIGNRDVVFPLASQHDIGLMIMKPLAGGLLCDGKAFPARSQIVPREPGLSASALLRSILANTEVSCVVPGTASPAEADENARAGHGPLTLTPGQRLEIGDGIRVFEGQICSRCGKCHTSCSQSLPISWLFRAGYISNFPSATFETPDEFDYIRLHPSERPTCESCPDITCSCPYHIDIPAGLVRIHKLMRGLMTKGLAPSSPPEAGSSSEKPPYSAKLVIQDFPDTMFPGTEIVCRLYFENTGLLPWYSGRMSNGWQMGLFIYVDGTLKQIVPLRSDTHAGQRCHFAFEFAAPGKPGAYQTRFDLSLRPGPSFGPSIVFSMDRDVTVMHPNSVSNGDAGRVASIVQRDQKAGLQKGCGMRR